MDYELSAAWPYMMNKWFKKRGSISMFRVARSFIVAAAIALVATSSAHADALSIELNGARIVKLDSPASDIIIANPAIADVTVQTPNRLVIIGKQAGLTRLIVMSDGAITMDTQVVVTMKNAGAQVSVFAPDGGNIAESQFSCSDRCTQVQGTARINGGGGGGGGGTAGGDGPIPTEPTVDQLPPPSPGGGSPSY
jgi:Flp pilus assembly secretin CpaC